jgi:hypothetical protein
MSRSGPNAAFQRVGDAFRLSIDLPAEAVENALLPAEHPKVAADRKRLAAAMEWVERLMPDTMDDTDHLEIIRALTVAAHSCAQAIECLACRGFYREALALSRSVFEAVVTARLLKHEPQLHTDIRKHENKTKQNIYDSWKSTSPPQSGAGHWYKGGFAALFQQLVKHEPQIATQKALTYQIGCSYTHSDLLSLRSMDEWKMAGVACGFTAIFLFLLAELLDSVWHGGCNDSEINEALKKAFESH